MNYITIATFIVSMLMSPAFAAASTFQNPVQGEIYNQENQPELYCLAMNIYHEARAEPIAGQYAVSDVVINRVYDTRYPNTICEVVLQGPVRESWKTRKDPDLLSEERTYYPVRHKCQFSWYCDGKADTTYDNDAWRLAQEIAYRVVVEKKYRGITEGSTHYHATYVNPSWAKDLTLVGRIGTHKFYRWSR
tara:strand:- start:272 stop:844 length:573 start_codon:yes stop_codon:yes gene_type:complete